ncbi:bromodomain-containing 4-like [Brachionus plicatilis]|uniref:Bromodomain-containing 4-like n=1 Tax=Brachionus plicatilis TaxID=10195 RepID=A0A3M7P6H5_BRAPC|nr:bromodomain-containing 4-like [Brachionus plicatilis]
MMAPVSCTNPIATNPPIRTFTTTPAVNSDNKYFSQYAQNYYSSSYTDLNSEINYSQYLYSEPAPEAKVSQKKQNRLSLLDDDDLIEKTAQLINKKNRIKLLSTQNDAQKYSQTNLYTSLPSQMAPTEYMDQLKQLQQQVEHLQQELRQKQLEQEKIQKKIQEHLIQTNFYSMNPALEQSRQNLRQQQEQIRQNLEQTLCQFSQYQNSTPSQARSFSYDRNSATHEHQVYAPKQRSSSHAPTMAKSAHEPDSRRVSRADQFSQMRPLDQDISAEYNRVLENLLRNESRSYSQKNVPQEPRVYEKSATMSYPTQKNVQPSEPRRIFLHNCQKPSFTDSGIYSHDAGLCLSKTDKSLELRVDDERSFMFERYLREIQMKRRLEEEKMREKEAYERKLMEAKQIEEKLKREHELREREALEQKLREKERLELQLREEQMKEKMRREQEQREKEALERALREKELIEKKLLEHQVMEKMRLEQEAKERENLERILREEKLKAAESRQKQQKEQEMLERQLREKEVIEQELRQQQVKEMQEKEVLVQKLREKELLEQKKKEQQKMKEKLKREKKQKLKNQENRLQINIDDFKRLQFPIEEHNSIFFDRYLNKNDPEVPSLNEDEIDIKDYSERLPKNYFGEFNLRRKVMNFGDEEAEAENEAENEPEELVEVAVDARPSNKLSSLALSNVEVILEEEEEEAQREYLEMMAYSKSNTINAFGHTRTNLQQNGYSSEGHDDDDYEEN